MSSSADLFLSTSMNIECFLQSSNFLLLLPPSSNYEYFAKIEAIDDPGSHLMYCCKSAAYLLHICCISAAYLLHIRCISAAYLLHIRCISAAYLLHIFSIIAAYLLCICSIFALYLLHIC